MTNPVHKLADGIRSFMNGGKEKDPYLEDDDLFADEIEQEEPLETATPEPASMEDDPKPKKKGFHLPSFRKKQEDEEKLPDPKKTSKADPKKRRRIAFGCTLLLLAGGFTYAYFFMDDCFSDDSTAPQTSTIATANQQKPKPGTKKDATQEPQVAVPLVNPFVDVSLLKKTGANADGTLPTMANAAPVPASSLPSIPSSSPEYPHYTETPRPSLPAIPSMGSLPAVPNANVPGEAPQPAARPNEVQGVITGSDGQNMAIMGDGTIVSEGETYNDGRIAYIGGDGIKFDDGSSLDYK